MRDIVGPLIKVLVVPFYKNHAGLLFFVFFIMFGIVESAQLEMYHTALIYGMLDSGIFLAVVLCIWLLYQLKTLHFLLKTCAHESSLFLQHLSLLSVSKSFLYLLIVIFLTFQPIAVYTIAIYVLGIKSKFYGEVVIIVTFQLMLLSLSAWMLNYTLRHRHVPERFTLPTLTLPYQQSLSGIYAGYLFKEEKSGLLLSKLFSVSLIYIVKETLTTGDDFRIIGITWLFALLSHTFLVQKLKVFEDHSMPWMRNLPIPVTHTFLVYVFLYSMLMIPELLLLVGNLGRGLSLLQFALLPVFSAAFLITIHSYLYKHNRHPDQFVTYLFWLFILCFMVILSKMIWGLAGALILIAFFLLRQRYYKYEALET